MTLRHGSGIMRRRAATPGGRHRRPGWMAERLVGLHVDVAWQVEFTAGLVAML